MPYKTWGCSICGAQAPEELRGHGKFKERMTWLREHYAFHHPTAYKRMMKKASRKRAEKG